MISRTFLVAAGLVAALALSACGGNGTSVSARGEPTTTSSTPSSTAPSALSGFKAVEYAGLRFQVPEDWPVYDLSKEPTRCARFDQHAVYLGHAGANQDCPAQLVGRTEAVQVEPIDEVSQTTVSRATQPGDINGLQVREDPSSAITRSLVAAFDSAGVVTTVTFRNDDALAQKILNTFEGASG